MRKSVQICAFLFLDYLSKKTFSIEPTPITRFQPLTKKLCAFIEFFCKDSSFIHLYSFCKVLKIQSKFDYILQHPIQLLVCRPSSGK